MLFSDSKFNQLKHEKVLVEKARTLLDNVVSDATPNEVRLRFKISCISNWDQIGHQVKLIFVNIKTNKSQDMATITVQFII